MPTPSPNMMPTPHAIKYIRNVSRDYKPDAYSNRATLVRFLRTGTLVNESSYTLTDAMIELLALGPGFVMPLSKKPKTKIHQQTTPNPPLEPEELTATECWANGINKAIASERRTSASTPIRGLSTVANMKQGILAANNLLERPTAQPETHTTRDWYSDKKIRRLLSQLNDAIPGHHFDERRARKFARLEKALQDLAKNTGIHILEADKGGATVVMDASAYDREALRQLGDVKTYKEIPETEYHTRLESAAERTRDVSKILYDARCLTWIEHSHIVQHCATPVGSEIYFLPKIHKEFNTTSMTFPGRPIAATFACVVHYIDKYITELTKPLLRLIPGSLCDTTDLLNKLSKDPLPPGARLLTADVNSLYPSIPWKQGVDAAVSFYAAHINQLRRHNEAKRLLAPPPPHIFQQALEIVLWNSLITYKNRSFYIQISGTPMGTCISVYLANTYMYYLTIHLVTPTSASRPKWLLLFERYIDDLILVIARCTLAEIDALFASISNDTITYTVTTPDLRTPALDVMLSICATSQCIETEPYLKPTSKQILLHYESSHPKHTLTALPLSQFYRLKRISSNDAIFQLHASRLTTNLTERGYPKKTVLSALAKANAKTRASLLTRASLTDELSATDVANSFKLITKFDAHGDWYKARLLLKRTHTAALAFYQKQGNGPTEVQRLAAAAILEIRQSSLVFSVRNKNCSYFASNYKHPKDKTTNPAAKI